jgi:hypothetical protein
MYVQGNVQEIKNRSLGAQRVIRANRGNVWDFSISRDTLCD